MCKCFCKGNMELNGLKVKHLAFSAGFITEKEVN